MAYVNVYGGAEFDPVNVMLGCAPFSQTVVVPAIIAVGSVVTVIDIVAFVAQVVGAVELGVKVYVAVPAAEVLIVAGDHVPAIPLFEVPGKASGVAL